MASKKRKRGRPRSKISRKAYLKANFLAAFYVPLEDILEGYEEEGLLYEKEAVSSNVQFRYGYPARFSGGFTRSEKQTRLNPELRRRAKSYALAKWAFSAGVYFGCYYIAKRALTQALKDIEELCNATTLLANDLRFREFLKRSMGLEVEKVEGPSDLLRQMRKIKRPEIGRREIVKLIRTIKEFDEELPYVEQIARELKLTVAEVKVRAEKAKKSLKFSIEIGKDESGKEFFVVN